MNFLTMNSIQFGIDILLENPPQWRNHRIGLVTNHAACTTNFIPSRKALLEAGFHIVKLFSPEHGLDTTGADGHEMQGGTDPLTGLPVISLYGRKLAPAKEDLSDIDLVLFDIPDVGCRFYTYLWTMTHVMEACASYDKPLIIADRPNPLSGRLDLAEGPLLDEAHCSSFIGRWKIPVRHSCTLGELAAYFCAEQLRVGRNDGVYCASLPLSDAAPQDGGTGASLTIIPCRNWRRPMFYPEWNTSFVPTSPAIPTFESALLFPGLGLLEATNISEGRGTATPFRMAGAPWMDEVRTAAIFNATLSNSAMPSGVTARPVVFTPTEGKFARQKCRGIMLHVSDPTVFRPVMTGWLLIRIIKGLHPDSFAWAPYPTFVNRAGARHLDLLTGLPDAESLFGTADLSKPVSTATGREIQNYTGTGNWAESIAPYLLYP